MLSPNQRLKLVENIPSNWRKSMHPPLPAVMTLLLACLIQSSKWFFFRKRRRVEGGWKREKHRFYLMFRSGIDLGGKTYILKVGLLASLALLRCQRSLNSLVKCTTSRLLVNCLWTHQKSTCLHVNEALCTWQGSSSHTYLSPWDSHHLSWKLQNKDAFHSGNGISPTFTLQSELTGVKKISKTKGAFAKH